MNDLSPSRKRRWSRLSRTWSTMVAVLVVTLIVGSAALFFNGKGHVTMTGSVGQLTPSIAAKPPIRTLTPAPSLDCTNRDDPGEHAVCKKGLETALHISKTIDGKKLTFLAAYADMQRVILKYTIDYPLPTSSSPHPMGDDVEIPFLTMQGSIELDGNSSKSSRSDSPTNQMIIIANFDPGKIPANTTELHLSAPITIFHIRNEQTVNHTKPVTVHFDTAIPFHGEKREAMPHQTVTVNGQSVTLERVVVTPSQTNVYLRIPALGSGTGSCLLSGKGWGALVSDGGRTWTSDGTKRGSGVGWICEAYQALFDKQGPWTVTVPTSDGSAGQGSWTFTFTVPPAANP